MMQPLFEILTDEELVRIKSIGLTRNVRIKDLTLEEVMDLGKVFWPMDDDLKAKGLPESSHPSNDVLQIVKQLKSRRAI